MGQKTKTTGGSQNPEVAKEVATEDTGAQEKIKRASLAEEILEGRVPGNSKEIIESIDLKKPPEKQKPALELLEGVGIVILIKLHKVGHSVTKKSDLASLVLTGFPDDVALNEESEKPGWKKFQEMIGDRDAPVSRYFLGELDTMIEVANEAASGARALINKDEKPKGGDKPTEDEKKEKDWVDKSKPYLGKVAVIGLAIAAAWGGLKLIGSLFGDAKEKEDDGFFSKHKKAIALAGLTACAAGVYLGRDNIRGWAKESFGVALTWASIKKFVKDIWNGNYDLGFGGLSDSVKVSELHKKTADKLHIDAEALEALGEASYDRFSGTAGELLIEGKSFIFGDLLPSQGIPFVYDPEKQKASIQAEQKLLALFKENKDYLDEHKPKTVDEALVLLDQRGILGGIPIILPPSEKKKAADKKKAEAPKKPEEVIPLSVDDEKKLADGFPPNVAPTIARVFANSKYAGRGKLRHWYDFAGDLADAVENDGKILATDGYSVAIWNGYKWFTLGSFKVLGHAVWNVLTAKSIGDLKGAVTTFWHEDKPFIVLGASAGGAIGLLTKSGSIRGAWTGAKIGLAAPVLTVRANARAARFIGEKVGGPVRFGVRKFLGSVEEQSAICYDEAAFWGRLFRQYHAVDTAIKQGRWMKLPDAGRKIARYFLTSKEGLRDAIDNAAKRFATAYNDARGLASSNPEFLVIAGDEAKEFGKTRTAIEEVLKKQALVEKIVPSVEVATSAAELKAGRAATPEGLAEFPNSKVNHMLREHGISPGTPEADVFMEKWDREMAERISRGQGISDGMPEFAKMNRLEFVKDLPNGGRAYRFRNIDITLNAAESAGKPLEIYQRCFAKWQGRAIELLTIKSLRQTPAGELEYNVNGKWVKADTPSSTADEIKAKFLEQFKEDPRAMEIVKRGGLSKYLNPRAFPYFSAALRVLGMAGLLYMIHNLETATNKREAVAIETTRFASFMGGSWATERALGKRFSNPFLKVAVDIMGGLLASYELTEPLGKIVDEYLARVPGSHAASQEVIDFFEKGTASVGKTMALEGVGWAAKNKLLTKVGLGSLEKVFTKKIESTALKEVAKFTSKSLLRKLLGRALGLKLAAMAAIAADDVTIIGVIDDVLAIPLALSMGYDVVQALKAVKNALTLQRAMEERKGKPPSSIKIKNHDAQVSIRKRLEPQMTPEDKGKSLEEILAKYDEEEIFTILRGEKEAWIDIKREGTSGVEQWIYKDGKVEGIKIFSDHGEMLAEVHNLDAESVEKKLDEIQPLAEAS